MRIAIAVLAFLLASTAAVYAQFNRCGWGFCPGQMTGPGFPPTGGGIPAATGNILLVDGASFLLQIDGTSKICRAGGC